MGADDVQTRVWNGPAGDAWVEHAEHYDATLAPFGEAAITALAPVAGERIVDIGCGAGATTLRLAQLVDPGEVTGIDLSVAMLGLAHRRSADAGIANARFEVGDVADGRIPGAPYDAAFSRFGVMFFADPAAAFSTIGDSLVAGGRLAFVCFDSPLANPFITGPVGAASRVLDLTPPPLGAPGPFSLADRDRTIALLTSAGFDGVTVEAGPDEAVVGNDDDLRSLAIRVLAQNPTTSGALRSADDTTRNAALDAAIEAMLPHCADGLVRMAASTWVVTARRP